MKTLVLAAAVAASLMVSGCGRIDRWAAGITGDATKTCVDGVTYLQFTSGATVQVDRAGRPVPCDD